MEKFKKLNPVLIVSDYFDRFEFIQYHVSRQFMSPVCYSNILAAREAVRVDDFSVVIIDLTLPLESKLLLIKEVCFYQPDTIVITIGKEKYLETSEMFSSFPLIDHIDSIYRLPDRLEVFAKHGVGFGTMAMNADGFSRQSLH